MPIDERYKRYNELTFEYYCKAAIDRAVARCRQQKLKQAQNEVYLDDLPEYRAAFSSAEITAIENGCAPASFDIGNFSIDIFSPELVAALRSLTPQKREILLLAYFLGKSDAEIAREMRVSKSAIQRRRTSAFRRIQELMRNIE